MNAPLPTAVSAFVDATNRRDSGALIASFAPDAVLTDMGEEHRGVAAIADWNDRLYLGSNVRIDVRNVGAREGATIVRVVVDGDYEAFGVTEPFTLDWTFTTAGEQITGLTMIEVTDPE